MQKEEPYPAAPQGAALAGPAITRREAELRNRIGELARDLGTVVQIQRAPSAQPSHVEILGPGGTSVQKLHVAPTGGEELARTIGRVFGLEPGTFVLRDKSGGTRPASSTLQPSQTYRVDVLSPSQIPTIVVDEDEAGEDCPAPEPTADDQMEGGDPDIFHTEELEKQETFPRRHELVGGRKALQDPDTQRLWQALTLKMYATMRQ